MYKRAGLLLPLILFISPSFAQEVQDEQIHSQKEAQEQIQTETQAENLKLKARIKTDSNKEPMQNIKEKKVSQDISEYLNNVKNKIEKNWHPSEVKKPNKVVSVIKINREGELLSIDFTRATGLSEYDKPAFYAIRHSMPFAPLPETYEGEVLEINYVFDYTEYATEDYTEEETKTPEEIQEEELKKAQEEELQRQREEELKAEKARKLMLKRQELYKRRAAERQYASEVQEKVVKNWKPVHYIFHSHQVRNNVSAEVSINKSGEIENIKIVHTERDKKAEHRVIKAIKKSAPFPPFPEETKKTRLAIRIKFGAYMSSSPSYRFE